MKQILYDTGRNLAYCMPVPCGTLDPVLWCISYQVRSLPWDHICLTHSVTDPILNIEAGQMWNTRTASISSHLFFISLYKHPQKLFKDAWLIYLINGILLTRYYFILSLSLKKTFRKAFYLEDWRVYAWKCRKSENFLDFPFSSLSLWNSNRMFFPSQKW